MDKGLIPASLGSLAFLVIAPGTVAGLVPWWLSRWRLKPPLLGWPLGRALGVVLLIAGLAVLVDSFARFALEGRGTPVPAFPTKRLVVSGLYRFVRNPMYLAVVSTIVGQGALFGSKEVLGYAALVGLAFHAFVVLYEEPRLRRRYGSEYSSYCAAVNRWVPRAGGWRGVAV
jgi:protein-S-isoprenylcysteine O-methyltransferase Ste14